MTTPHPFWSVLLRRSALLTLLLVGAGIPLSGESDTVGAARTNWIKLARELVADREIALPEWYLSERVQGFTRLRIAEHDSWAFRHAAEAFDSLGARVFVRHVKSGDEDPWWNSAALLNADGTPTLESARELPGGFMLGDTNVVQAAIDDAHARDMRLIAYYWPMTDRSAGERFPEAVCRDMNGEILRHRKRGEFLDITYEPYRDVVARRLLELAAMGVDGFFFDEQHLPSIGSWGTALEAAFKRETGRDAPRSVDPDDPAYREFLDFKAYKIVETFVAWEDFVHAEYPDVIFVISNTWITGIHHRDTPLALARISSSPKNEYALPLRRVHERIFDRYPDLAPLAGDIKLAFGWTLLRAAAQGRPGYYWTPGTPNRAHALAYAGALVGYGNIAAMDSLESYLDGVPDTALEASRREGDLAALAYGQEVSPVMSGATPCAWAAVYFSEDARNLRPTAHAAWTEVNAPLLSAFQLCVRARVPVNVVTDFEIEQIHQSEYQVLFVADRDELTTAANRAVVRFESAGGRVVNLAEIKGWGTQKSQGAAYAQLRETAQSLVADTPITSSGGPDDLHMTVFHGADPGELVINFANEFSWVQEARAIREGHAELNLPPPAVSGVVIHARGNKPSRAWDVLHRRNLPVRATTDGFAVDVPEFAAASTILLSF